MDENTLTIVGFAVIFGGLILVLVLIPFVKGYGEFTQCDSCHRKFALKKLRGKEKVEWNDSKDYKEYLDGSRDVDYFHSRLCKCKYCGHRQYQTKMNRVHYDRH